MEKLVIFKGTVTIE